ncbi:hypothetical protein WJ63_35025 [Burkholderia pyrrocinia]|nr:hypothetical protein WJ63_35025 [Burkholderia pyrrocinia]
MSRQPLSLLIDHIDDERTADRAIGSYAKARRTSVQRDLSTGKRPIPAYLLRIEWNRLRMVGDFELAIVRDEIRAMLEASHRAREARATRRAVNRVDIKRLQAGDTED